MKNHFQKCLQKRNWLHTSIALKNFCHKSKEEKLFVFEKVLTCLLYKKIECPRNVSSGFFIILLSPLAYPFLFDFLRSLALYFHIFAFRFARFTFAAYFVVYFSYIFTLALLTLLTLFTLLILSVLLILLTFLATLAYATLLFFVLLGYGYNFFLVSFAYFAYLICVTYSAYLSCYICLCYFALLRFTRMWIYFFLDSFAYFAYLICVTYSAYLFSIHFEEKIYHKYILLTILHTTYLTILQERCHGVLICSIQTYLSSCLPFLLHLLMLLCSSSFC